MTLYLLHWSPPLAGSKRPDHYLGWTNRPVEDRVAEHLNDGHHAARVVVAAVDQGREVTLARIWPGATRLDESKMKHRKKKLDRDCPICRPELAGQPGVILPAYRR